MGWEGPCALEINFNFLQSWEFDPFYPDMHTHISRYTHIHTDTNTLSFFLICWLFLVFKGEMSKGFQLYSPKYFGRYNLRCREL